MYKRTRGSKLTRLKILHQYHRLKRAKKVKVKMWTHNCRENSVVCRGHVSSCS